MNFVGFFILAVVMMMINPTQFAALGHKLIVGLQPIAKEGLTLAIMIAAIGAILGRLK